MDQRCYEFEAVIESTPDGKGAFVRFPLDLRKEFSVGRLKVDAAFDGVPYAGSLVNMGVKTRMVPSVIFSACARISARRCTSRPATGCV